MKANSYLQQYENYFWQWEDDYEFVAIPGSHTIAYKKEIIEAIENLSSQGLPPFGALFLVMCVLSRNGDVKLIYLATFLMGFNYNSDCIKGGLEMLKIIAALPLDYRIGKNKQLILRTIFENCHNSTSLKKSYVIAREVCNANFSITAVPQKLTLEQRNTMLDEDFRIISLLSKKFKSADDIIHKLASLPKIEEELVLEEHDSSVLGEPKNFIEELCQNSETFKVGSLIKRIWSGLNIPFHSSVPSDQTLGGVSDLANKGNLDQLLLSELANDDTTLLLRLANNEALYMKRESPPSSNNFKRILLVDVSLKNWGTPKLLSIAIAVAISDHPRTDISCECYAVGSTYEKIEVHTIDAVIQSLQKVDASLECSGGLEKFFTEHPYDTNSEIFLLSCKEVESEAKYQRALSDYGNRIGYLTFSGRSGEIEIYKKHKTYRKHLQNLKLNLENEWTNVPNKKKEELKKQNSEYPILVGLPFNNRGVRQASNGDYFSITREKKVVRKINKSNLDVDMGWEIIMEHVNISDKLFEVGISSEGVPFLLTVDSQKSTVYIYNIDTKEKRDFLFKISNKEFIFFKNAFYHTNNQGIWKISLDMGVEKKTSQNFETIKSYYQKINQKKSPSVYYYEVLKNVSHVGISGKQIKIGKHVLTVRSNEHITFVPDNTRNEVSAISIDDSTFQFNDGSKVIIDKSGVFTLQSSNAQIPTIYVASVLQRTTAVATNDHFAGNIYFYKQPVYMLRLISCKEPVDLYVIRQLKQAVNLGLADVTYAIENVPHILPSYYLKTPADKIVADLQKKGIVVKAKECNKHSQTRIDVDVFNEKYIERFIMNILDYEKNNSTS